MRLTILAHLFCWYAIGHQPVLVQGEPGNLDTVKQQLKHYQACPEADCYVPQLEHQRDLAICFLRQSVDQAKPPDKMAIVLDIDETSLSNWAVDSYDDFGYITADSNWCVALRCGKAISGTLRWFQEAIRNHVTVFFITGRSEGQRRRYGGESQSGGFQSLEACLSAAGRSSEKTDGGRVRIG